MEKETAMKILKELHGKSLFAERTALETLIPELKESEDEKIRKALVRFHKSTIDIDGIKGADILAWLEKQCYTKKDVDDAYLKGISDAKNELEKQGEQKSVLDFKASNWYVSKVDGKIHDMTYNPADKVEPIFSIGDVLCDKSCTTLNKNSQPNIEILDIRDGMYICNNCSFPISQQDEYELVAKKIEDEIEIPFGAKDSELQEETYYIPKGFHAEIDDDKVVIKKGEKPVAWSDEDRDLMYDTLSNLTELKDLYGKDYGKVGKCIDWLKSLKNRIGG